MTDEQPMTALDSAIEAYARSLFEQVDEQYGDTWEGTSERRRDTLRRLARESLRPLPPRAATTEEEEDGASIVALIGAWLVERIREGAGFTFCQDGCRHCGSGPDEPCRRGCPCWPYSTNDDELHRLADTVTACLNSPQRAAGTGS